MTTSTSQTRTQAGAWSWPKIASRWIDLVPKVCGRWPKLTYMEVLATTGQRSRVCELLVDHYGLSRQEADDALFAWQAELARDDADRTLVGSTR